MRIKPKATTKSPQRSTVGGQPEATEKLMKAVAALTDDERVGFFLLAEDPGATKRISEVTSLIRPFQITEEAHQKVLDAFEDAYCVDCGVEGPKEDHECEEVEEDEDDDEGEDGLEEEGEDDAPDEEAT